VYQHTRPARVGTCDLCGQIPLGRIALPMHGMTPTHRLLLSLCLLFCVDVLANIARMTSIGCISVTLAYLFHRQGFQSMFSVEPKSLAPFLAIGIPVLVHAACRILLSVRSSEASSRMVRTPIPRRLRVVLQSGVLKLDAKKLMVACMLYFMVSELIKKRHLTLEGTSNTIAFTSIITMGLFTTLSVARYNAVVEHQLHIWAGWMVVLGTLTHGSIYVYTYLTDKEPLRHLFLPPLKCFNPATDPTDPLEHCTEKICSCYSIFLNLTGLLAVMSFLTMGVTAMRRRKSYELFYRVHRVAGPIATLCIMLHWKRSIMFLSGAMLFYMACSAPVWWENWSKKRQGGTQIVQVDRLGSTCMAVTFACRDTQRLQAGQYVRLICPDVSSVAHPFTVNTVPDYPKAIRIIFRATGNFTRQLQARLANTANLPAVILDGFVGESRLSQLLSHDVSVLFAGGVGITPYLDMLHAALHRSRLRPVMARTISLHWICRDPELIDHVKTVYFNPLLEQDTTGLTISITIHSTGLADEESPFSLEASLVPETSRKGIPFVPSHFATGSRVSITQNLPSFVYFVLTTGGGACAAWYFYRNVQDARQTGSRIWAPLLLALLCLIAAFVVHFMFYSGILTDADTMTDQGEHDSLVSDDVLEMTKTKKKRVSSSTRLSTEANTSSLPEEQQHTLTLKTGRPVIDALVGGIESSLNPAVFFCGPASLTSAVKHCIGTRARIYEEKFYK